MVTPLRNRASGTEDSTASLRFSAAWNTTELSIADTRAAVRTLLVRAGHEPDGRSAQDAQLVVSELVTNALRHAPGPGQLVLEVLPDAALLRITVRDGCPDPPEPRTPNPRRIGGHGLILVTRLCEQLRTVPLDDGKQIIAHLRLGAASA
ncbi:ATP-binding protein [Streptomyces sp. NPDC048491]|uniref:ATP-binding protein n=1 Tax=Streptomyces sp. NPDC048491 TaxID=3157207 RepID=UPI0034279615